MANLSKDLSQEQIEAIENYGDNITTLKDFIAICRKRPGYQLGSTGPNGLLNMIREIFQNAVDQVMDPTSPCNWFSVYYNERTLEVIVSDNGKGLPKNDMVRIITKEYTSKNYEKRKGEYSSGLHGVGLKVVNALSEECEAISYKYDGTAAKLEMRQGYPTTNKPVDIPNKDKRQGTVIRFIPDSDIMGVMDLSWKRVYRLIKNIMSLTPIGSTMDFKAVDMEGNEINETITNKDGIVTGIIDSVKFPIIAPITCGFDDGEHKLECAICFDAGGEDGPADTEHVIAFSNFCPTRGGTHVDGTIEGICRWFSTYMNNIFLSNQKAKEKIKVIANDIKNGLNVMISAAHIEPVFSSQGKDVLSNSDMIPFCKEVVSKGLDEWSKSNPNDLAKICKFFKDIAEIRMKNDKSKAKIVTKYKANVLTGLPRKYVRPLGKKNIELIIVEGDKLLHCL